MARSKDIRTSQRKKEQERREVGKMRVRDMLEQDLIFPCLVQTC